MLHKQPYVHLYGHDHYYCLIEFFFYHYAAESLLIEWK